MLIPESDEELIFTSSVIPSCTSIGWTEDVAPVSDPQTEKRALIERLKQRSPDKFVAILHELVKHDANKAPADRLFPRLRTRCNIWFKERDNRVTVLVFYVSPHTNLFMHQQKKTTSWTITQMMPFWRMGVESRCPLSQMTAVNSRA